VEFQRELLARLPLADSVLSLLGYLWSPSFLDGLFDAHRGRCYEQDLTFPRLVELVRDALLVHHGSGRASFEAADARGELPVLAGSVYQKLARLPVAVSQALLRETACRLPELLPGAGGGGGGGGGDANDPPLPASLGGLEVVALDGKVLKHVHRRLKPLRPLQGRLLGGRVLVALAVRPGLALALDGCEDAERNDCPLVPGAVAQVREQVARDVLFVADRQMCDLGLMALFARRPGDHFLVRHNRTLSFEPDPGRPPQHGTDAKGRPFVQAWGWAGAASQRSRRRYVRRITLARGGAAGEEDVALLTDLLDERAYPAADLLEAYRRRWGIEQVFQQVTEVFNLRHLIGTRPLALIFQAAFCLVLYNLTQVVRHYVARAGRCAAAGSVSARKLFEDVAAEATAWAKLGEPAVLLAHVRALGLPAGGPAAMRRHLRGRLGKLWRDRWRKSPARTRPAPAGQRRTVRVKGGRSSVWKVLQQHRGRVATHEQKPRRC
jgi:DDE family transposase